MPDLAIIIGVVLTIALGFTFAWVNTKRAQTEDDYRESFAQIDKA